MNIKKLKIYNILFHCFIVIGVGHGIGVMGIFDLLGIIQIPTIFKNGIEFDFNGEFEDRLSLVVISSLTGKLFLISSLLIKKNQIKNITGIFALLFLWSSIFILTSGNWNYNSLYEIAFWTSVPFLISSTILTFLIVKNIKQNSMQNIELNEKQNI